MVRHAAAAGRSRKPERTAFRGGKGNHALSMTSPPLSQHHAPAKEVAIAIGGRGDGALFGCCDSREEVGLDDHSVFSKRAFPSTHDLTIDQTGLAKVGRAMCWFRSRRRAISQRVMIAKPPGARRNVGPTRSREAPRSDLRLEARQAGGRVTQAGPWRRPS
jgi:hypothetical protein